MDHEPPLLSSDENCKAAKAQLSSISASNAELHEMIAQTRKIIAFSREVMGEIDGMLAQKACEHSE